MGLPVVSRSAAPSVTFRICAAGNTDELENFVHEA